MVDPERDPGEHDDQNRRKIVLEDEEPNVPLQAETQRQPLVLPYDKEHQGAT